jgi:hypothetical protein
MNRAARTFAKLDLSVPRQDQLILLGAFGISNFLTGALFHLISTMAAWLSPYIRCFSSVACGMPKRSILQQFI